MNSRGNRNSIEEYKYAEIMEIYGFLDGLEEYGYIYHCPLDKLDEPFEKILEGIAEIQQLLDDSYEM